MQHKMKHDTVPHFGLRYFLSQVYDLLLYVYPPSFRREYGEPMAQLFRDETRESLRKGGIIDLISYLFHTLVDLLLSMSSEHMNKIVQTTKEEAMKWLALSFVFLGLISGIFGMVNPEAIFDFFDLFLTPGGLIAGGAMRVAFGVALIVAADASRAPNTLRILGALIFLIGITMPFIGVEFFREVMDWYTGNGVESMRIGLSFSLLFGISILYAFTPRHWFTSTSEAV